MVALDRQGRAWVASIGSGTASVIDLAGRKLVATIPTGKGAEGIDVTPDGTQAWVTNREDGTVTVIDTASLKAVASLTAGSFPIRAKATPDGRHVLVSNARSGDLSVFDAKERKEVRRVRFDVAAKGGEGRFMAFAEGSTPIGIVVAPDGRKAFVAHAGADAVSVIDLASWTPVGRLPAGKEPDGMAYSPVAVAR
jgi:YVTN family beta-propeller protein